MHASLLFGTGVGSDASNRAAGYTAVYCPFFNKDFTMKRYIAALFAVLVLAGCGQKGPLFLPEQTATQPASPVQPDLRQQPTEN